MRGPVGRRRARQVVLAAGLSALALAGCSGPPALRPRAPGTSPTPAASPTPAPTPTPTVPPVSLVRLASFAAPVWVGPVPGDPTHLFLAQRSGSVLELDEAGQQVGVVLSMTRQVSKGAEQGLLSLAFDPAYPRNHRLYVDYTGPDGSTCVDAWTVVHGVAVQQQRLLTVAHPFRNHNGGQLLFDRAGMLLVGTGDGGNAGDPDNVAQDPDSMLGKILRIDPRDGSPAPGNPFATNRYVWATGLRNPWRFSFAPNGDLYLGDAGQTHQEEIDVVPPSRQRGANYGWSVYEGDQVFKKGVALTTGGPLIMPALVYDHVDGGCAVTAGEVYRGRLLPWLRDRFVYGDYCLGRVMAVTPTRSGLGTPVDLGVKVDAVVSFGHDGYGELLVLSLDGLYRLVAGA